METRGWLKEVGPVTGGVERTDAPIKRDGRLQEVEAWWLREVGAGAGWVRVGHGRLTD